MEVVPFSQEIQIAQDDIIFVLQAAKPWPDEENTHIYIDADTQCLHLVSLLFDTEITIYEAIQHWRCCVACCEYGLDPEFIMLD